MTKTFEPLWWSLFSAGGVVAALFLPIMILLSGIGMPLEWFGVAGDVFAYERVRGLVTHPIVQIFLFVLISLPLFHAAHRIHAALSDPWLKHMESFLSILLYGGAFAGTILTAVILLQF